jgi:hypothetical protein
VADGAIRLAAAEQVSGQSDDGLDALRAACCAVWEAVDAAGGAFDPAEFSIPSALLDI